MMGGFSGFQIVLDVIVSDTTALWSAAAGQALGCVRMTIGDVIDTLGPREDPDVAACLAMMVDPARFAGCTVAASEVGSVAAARAIAHRPGDGRISLAA